MGSADLQGFQFADSQESHFEAAKHSEMSSAVLQGDRFAEAEESCFQVSKMFGYGQNRPARGSIY